MANAWGEISTSYRPKMFCFLLPVFLSHLQPRFCVAHVHAGSPNLVRPPRNKRGMPACVLSLMKSRPKIAICFPNVDLMYPQPTHSDPPHQIFRLLRCQLPSPFTFLIQPNFLPCHDIVEVHSLGPCDGFQSQIVAHELLRCVKSVENTP
jgi:hypothetical protein